MFHLPSKGYQEQQQGRQQGNRRKYGDRLQYDPTVLLVNATEPRMSLDRKTQLHVHSPTLSFRPEDLDDFSLDLATLQAEYRLIPGKGADHIAILDLLERTVEIVLHPEDLEGNSFQVAPADGLEAVPQLPRVDERIVGLKKQCFDGVVDNRLVAARIPLTAGKLEKKRIGGSRIVGESEKELDWEFYPHVNLDGEPVRTQLADQVSLTFTGLRHPIRLRLGGYCRGELIFPCEIPEDSGDAIEVSIANLPILPNIPDTSILTHFRWFYELVEWKGDGLPGDLPAPRPYHAKHRVIMVGGATGLCPNSSCP